MVAAGAHAVFVALSVPPATILTPERGRAYSDAERLRIHEMVEEGYDRPRWADLTFAPGAGSPLDNAERLLAALDERNLLRR